MSGQPQQSSEGGVTDLAAQYQEIRRTTERICAPLATEDYVVQAMPDASPPKWHLAHVSWFFETFLLKPYLAGYQPLDPRHEFLFNSYYNSVGPQYFRPHRGHLSRPTVAEVYEYRAHVDQAMLRLIEGMDGERLEEAGPLLVLGLHHEQQHQELLLTDIKYNLGVNPLRPAYHAQEVPRAEGAPPLRWRRFEGGLQPVGHDGHGFAFDNEQPRHQTYLRPYRLASRPVTNGEYLQFMDAEGYQRPELWLSDGWGTIKEQGWAAPLYWQQVDGGWWTQTLSGMLPLDEHAPAAHISYYEADAYAHWAGKRLPTEQEWEHAAGEQPIEGNLLESGICHPMTAPGDGSQLEQLFGDVWEWTRSAYTPYPGFQPLEGAPGEYNGKFMVNQMVLRGGSCVTPQSHIRRTYRNFFHADARWQFSGLRLAEDA